MPASAAPAPDLGAIRADVAALAAMDRASARQGERDAARWVAARLVALGLEPVVHDCRYQHSYALAHGAHVVAALAAIARGGMRGALATLAALGSLEAEVSGRRQWIRALLPAGDGVAVAAHVPAANARTDGNGGGAAHAPRATVVLVAHLDAANTGWVWHPLLARLGAARTVRTRRMDPVMAPLAIALLVGAAGCALPRRTRLGRALRAVAGAVATGSLSGYVSVARGTTVPGASDNASGVAVVLALAHQLQAAPATDVDVIVVFPGTEEAGMGGMRAFLDAGGLDDALARGPVLVLGVDTLGAGTPIVAGAEGTMATHRYDPAAVELVRDGARHAGVDVPDVWRIGGWTDPVLAHHRGIPATCLLSVGPDGHYTNYHLPTDVPEHVDWASVEACARIVRGVIDRLDACSPADLSRLGLARSL